MGGVDFTVLPVDPILLAVVRRHVEKIDGHDWHASVRKMQDRLNSLNVAQELARDLLPLLRDVVQSRDIKVTELYLRAARPHESGDAIGWHRESMYGGEPQLFNAWIPIRDVTPESTIKYIPGSTAIPDAAIKVEQVIDGQVEKDSDSHRIGLLYAPKRIVDGVDLTRAVPMDVPEGHAAVFPGSLVHGAAQNHTGRVRFSMDFRIIAKEHAKRAAWLEL